MKKTLTLLMVLTSICCYAQKVKLVLNLKIDSVYYLDNAASLTMVQSIAGQEQKIITAINGRIANKVIAIRDTVYEIEVRYKTISMHMDMAGQAMDFNADKTDPFSKIMMTMRDKPFTMFMSKTGRVVDVKNTDNLYKGMFDSFPQVTDAQKAEFKTQMEQSFGNEAIKNGFQDVFPILPGAKTAVNDTWVANTAITSALSAKVKTTYMLVGINEACYVINSKAVIYSDKNPEYKASGSLSMRFIDIAGTANAEITIDKATGWLSASKTIKNIKGTVEIKDSEKVPGGMIFPMTVDAILNATGK
jgi:hypothetical protein